MLPNPYTLTIDRYTTKAICEAIYGSIDGAFYDAATGYYNVPCTAEIDMAIQIGCVLITKRKNIATDIMLVGECFLYTRWI